MKIIMIEIVEIEILKKLKLWKNDRNNFQAVEKLFIYVIFKENSSIIKQHRS